MTYVALEDPPKFEKSIDLKLKMCSIKCALETLGGVCKKWAFRRHGESNERKFS